MNPTYVFPVPRWKILLFGGSAIALPAFFIGRGMWESGRGALHIRGPWWTMLLVWVPLLVVVPVIVALNRSYFRPARLEADGNRLTIRFGVGLQNPRVFGRLGAARDQIVVDLTTAHLEWAGLVLNLRTREVGTILLGYYGSVEPLAAWFTAQGHPPIRAY